MGIAKAIVFDANAVEARVASRLAQYGLERSSRLLAGLPPSTSGTFFIAQAVLRVGATLVYFDETSALADLAECTHALMLPVLLDRLAKQAGGLAPMHRSIKIFAVGAKLGESTRALAQATLNAELMDAYGTTETGWLAMFGESSVGDVLPGVDLEVVGPDDQALSSAAFRDGWYYTGDFARMPAARRIELIGRADALLNFGGIKISPETIEAALMARSIAADVAALSRAGADGIAQLWLALVAPRLTGQALERELASALGANLGPIQVVLVDQVPRNAAGKLLRAEVRALVERQLGAH
jgi:acyl-coenzyme A synthetase/AMP-(fatty) acid ligase